VDKVAFLGYLLIKLLINSVGKCWVWNYSPAC